VGPLASQHGQAAGTDGSGEVDCGVYTVTKDKHRPDVLLESIMDRRRLRDHGKPGHDQQAARDEGQAEKRRRCN